ncbi:hypothetical protein GCM10027020_09400 [Nocardioides salsibiostraticola]
MLRGLITRFTRAGGGAGRRTTPGIGGTGAAGGGSSTDAALGRGIRKFFRRAR